MSSSSADLPANAAMTTTTASIPAASDTAFPTPRPSSAGEQHIADTAAAPPPAPPSQTAVVTSTATSNRKVRKRKRNNANNHHHHGHHQQQQQQQQQHHHQHHHHGNALAHLNGKKWSKQLRQQHQTKQQHQQQLLQKQQHQQQQQQNNNNTSHKPDSENIPSAATGPPKNPNANGRNKPSGPKGIYKAIVHRNGGLNLSAGGAVIGVGVAAPIVANLSAPLLPPGAKFYLPNEKRLRKELIVPPTKFLLGGNISDPLNLNSLQDEALNASMNAATPKRSPITTPPKIDVLIPPNMFDPLHLLDVPDADKYEQLLTSPLKQRSKAKHRNRKKKAAAAAAAAAAKKTGDGVCAAADDKPSTTVSCDVTDDENCSLMDDCSSVASSRKRDTLDMSAAAAALTGDARDRCTRELKLDLSTDHHSNGPLPSRKRKTSESSSVPGSNSAQKKARRLDAMDKIVSPVIPQPGAWKRPPLVLPMGAPRNRVRNTSVSIADTALDGGDVLTPANEAAPSIGSAAVNTTAAAAAAAADGQATTTPTALSLLAVAPSQATKVLPAQQQQQQQLQTVAKLPATAKYQYGNYNRYAGFNSLDEFSDVRLHIFSRHAYLFRGKDLLDIGCNVGHMTVAIARKLHPKSIVGIDIDASLIARARHNLKLYVKMPSDALSDRRPTKNQQRKRKHQQQHPQQQQQQHRRSNANKDAYYPISMPICFGPMPPVASTLAASAAAAQTPSAQPDTVTDSATGVTTTVKSPSSVELTQFPHNIYFRTLNYAQLPGDEPVVEAQQYDLILCLSVTKWLQLNYGDVGLKAAFRRMFNQLRPGGKLVLEAQNWASYKIKKRLTQTIFNNYKSIEFFPNAFHEYLLSPEVGFSHSYTLGIARHATKGFRRPVQLYIKGDFTPSQVCWSDNYHAETPYNQYPENNYVDLRRPPPFYSSWQQQDGFGLAPPNQGGLRYGSSSAHGDSGVGGDGGTGGGSSGSYTPYLPFGPGSARAPNAGAPDTTPYGRTPLNGLSYTSQYYNPLETDSYLPSYDNEVQTRHYCFASPLYSTVWSPPSSGAGPSWSSGNNNHRGGGGGGGGGGSGGNSVGRRSASTTPLFGSIRKVTDGDDGAGGPSGGRGHVYFNNMAAGGGGGSGRDSQRSVDECSQSPQMQMYMYAAPNTPRSGSCSARDACGASPRDHVYADVVREDGGGGGVRGVGGGGENSSSPIRQYSGESSRSIEEEEVLPMGSERTRE